MTSGDIPDREQRGRCASGLFFDFQDVYSLRRDGNKGRKLSGTTMNVLSFLVFVPLQILFLPLAIVGVLLVAYKQMVVSKRLGVSQTAVEVLNGRWTMHVFGMRRDQAAAQLAGVVPNTSTFGLWLVLFPLWIKYRMSGTYFGYPRLPEQGSEAIGDIIVARTFYFDRIIERVVGDVEQFVLLGAGLDTRPYGHLRREGLACFELDQPTTQKLKIEALRAAGIDTGHVNFVAVDFSSESAFQKLREHGYDSSKRTLFLWEGVTLYLSEADVRKTLEDIREHAATGSVVVADFYGERMIRVGSGSVGKKALAYTNEGFGFGLPFSTQCEESLRDFLESENLKQGASYFMGRTSPKGPFMVVVELGV